MSRKFGVSFADHFNINEEWFKSNNVFNPTLDVDSPLFIDPFLLTKSKHAEISNDAFDKYEEYLLKIKKLLLASRTKGDKPWAAATKMFQISESKGLNGTCLGYAKHSTHGSAIGPKLASNAISWSKEVLDLGVEDPELFSIIPLFEKNFGADRISDMVTSIISDQILDFNKRVLFELKNESSAPIPTEEFTINGRKELLPRNPFDNQTIAPIILVPSDILRHLPLVEDPRSIPEVIKKNEDLRDKVNAHAGQLWAIKKKSDREHLTKIAMNDAVSFQCILDIIKLMETSGYDVNKDPQGLLEWRTNSKIFSALSPLKILLDTNRSRIDQLNDTVTSIIEQFRHLVEDCRMYRTFHVDGEPRHESYAQMLFFSIAKSYCDANDLDISPEADAGVGPVDFKFSHGSDNVIVEIKLSTNQKIVSGYKKQIEEYRNSNDSKHCHYVVIDVGKIGNKYKNIKTIHAEHDAEKINKSIYLIDGNLRQSASKL